MEASTVYTVGKTPAIAGLTWRQLPVGSDAAMDMRVDARDAESKFAAVTKVAAPDGELTRYAIVPREHRKLGRTGYSAALWLAHAVQKPTIYVEATDERGSKFLVLMVRPGGEVVVDAVRGEREAAKALEERLSEAERSEDVDLVVGGKHRALPSDPSAVYLIRVEQGTLQRVSLTYAGLAALLKAPPPPQARFQQVAGIKPKTVIGVLVVAALASAAAAGYKVYERMEQERRHAEELQRAAMEDARRAQLASLKELRIEQAVERAVKDATSGPEGSAVVGACLGSLRVFSRVLAGWSLQGVSCDPVSGTASATYDRTHAQRRRLSTFDDFRSAVRELGLDAAFELGSDVAQVSVPVDMGPSRPGLTREDLPHNEQVVMALGPRFQWLGNLGNSTGVNYTAASPQKIVFEDPEKEHLPSPQERMTDVPAERGFLLGRVQVSTKTAWLSDDLGAALAGDAVRVASVQIKTDNAATMDVTIEATYAMR